MFDTAYFTNPYATFARLRQAGSVHRVLTPDGLPIWLITGDAEVRAALLDARLALNKAHAHGGYAGFSLPPTLDANLLNRDGADHARLRRLAAVAFTPRRIDGIRDRLDEVVTELADRLAERGTGDLVADYAASIPLRTMGHLLGVPANDQARFAQWTRTMLAPDHPEQVSDAVAAIHRFLLDLIADRRAQPGHDLLSGWITARDEGDRLDENELVSLTFLILWAGIENVTHLISHGTLQLLRHPEQITRLRADPGLLPVAVEELLRYAHADMMAIRRFATEDLHIHGTRIPAGDTVMLALASANRDPARHHDPDRLDLDRNPNTHLSFGLGPHYCLGAALARQQLQLAFDTLLRRFPRLTLATDITALRWRPSFRSHSLLALPVTV
ncbi:cytochrome P450 family protein [Amycolatopsis cihanbeyliensis]|uniref:cytochrome P450 family protein n=1 Tax=Amycolatopsis cihanbeyliensis TaxID=1128664 RepID=UPI001FE7B277|nr:cytochrome P450 [Amycolatopsis cihanbeyliensis]